MATDKVLTGIAGEYFVAGELSKRGYLAALTQRNTAGVDILATNKDSSRSVSIQVKTTTGNRPSWRLGAKDELVSSPHVFYVLVQLNSEATQPDYYIVPSVAVSSYIYRTHREWLAYPKKDGTPRKDSTMRVFNATEPEYRDAWSLLGLD